MAMMAMIGVMAMIAMVAIKSLSSEGRSLPSPHGRGEYFIHIIPWWQCMHDISAAYDIHSIS